MTEEAPCGGGFKMLSGAFLNVGKTGCKLSALIPTGYLENEDFEEEGTAGEFNIQCLGPDGQVGDTYSWVHGKTKGEWDAKGHWETPDGEVVYNSGTQKFDNDVEFTAGEGFYFKSPDHCDDEDTPYTMTLTYPLAK